MRSVPLVCRTSVGMARKVGQIVGRGRCTWLVRVYNGRDPETKRRNYLSQTIHGGLRDAQAHLNKMLGERDRGRNLDSSKQTLNQYLDRWLELCAKPRLRAKSLQDYEGLLRSYVRPRLGTRAMATVSAFDIQTLYGELLNRSLSARSIRYTHAVLRSALKQAVRWDLILANPADFVDLPRQDRRRVGVLSVEQARAFVKAIAGHSASKPTKRSVAEISRCRTASRLSSPFLRPRSLSRFTQISTRRKVENFSYMRPTRPLQ